MKTKLFLILSLLFTLISCSKENIDETNEVILHRPTVVTDNDAAVSFKVNNSNTESTFEGSYLTSHGDFYFITPHVPCIEAGENGSFTITSTGDEEYNIFLSKSSGEYSLVTSFLLTNDPDADHISTQWDSTRDIPCITNAPRLEILDETDDYLVGNLEAEFFQNISDEAAEDPFSFCDRTESIGMVSIEFVAIKTESECE